MAALFAAWLASPVAPDAAAASPASCPSLLTTPPPLFSRLQPQNYDWQTTREIAAIEEGVEEEMTGESAAQHTPACLPVPA